MNKLFHYIIIFLALSCSTYGHSHTMELNSVGFAIQDCLKRCMDLIKKGASVFFFPEGTRSKDGKLGSFKVRCSSKFLFEHLFCRSDTIIEKNPILCLAMRIMDKETWFFYGLDSQMGLLMFLVAMNQG